MVYGAEGWLLDDQTCKILNGANGSMMSHITGKSIKDESSKKTRTFNLIKWIRARRLKWLGHILRLPEERFISKATRTIYDHRQIGDLLMDAPDTTNWDELRKYAANREQWRVRVRRLKPAKFTAHHDERDTTNASMHHEADNSSQPLFSIFIYVPHITDTQRPRPKMVKTQKRQQTAKSDSDARKKFHAKHIQPAVDREAREQFFKTRTSSKHPSDEAKLWQAHMAGADYGPAHKYFTRATHLAAAQVFSDSSADSTAPNTITESDTTEDQWAAPAEIPDDTTDATPLPSLHHHQQSHRQRHRHQQPHHR